MKPRYMDEPIGYAFKQDPIIKRHYEPTTLAIIGLGLQAVSMIQQMDAADAQADATRQQAEAQRKAEEAKGRMAERQAARERISALREDRIRRAQIIASAGSQGIGAGTSAVSGSTSSSRSQAGANVGFINQQETFAGMATQANQEAADAASRAASAHADGQFWQSISGVGSQLFQTQGGWTTIFGGNTFNQTPAPVVNANIRQIR